MHYFLLPLRRFYHPPSSTPPPPLTLPPPLSFSHHLSISLAQQHRFLEMLVAAIQSVVPLSPDTDEWLTSSLHALDDAIARPNLPGCSQGGCLWGGSMEGCIVCAGENLSADRSSFSDRQSRFLCFILPPISLFLYTPSPSPAPPHPPPSLPDGAWLQWRHGAQLNTTITAGGRVNWVWAEDEPMSIQGEDLNVPWRGCALQGIMLLWHRAASVCCHTHVRFLCILLKSNHPPSLCCPPLVVLVFFSPPVQHLSTCLPTAPPSLLQ